MDRLSLASHAGAPRAFTQRAFTQRAFTQRAFTQRACDLRALTKGASVWSASVWSASVWSASVLLASVLLATALCCGNPIQAHAAEITVPVDVGVGPAFYHGVGPVFADAPGHYGIKISLAAVINRAMIRRHIKRVPKQYRKMALGMREFRYRPSMFIPSSLFISPKLGKTGMYGATWRPVGLSMPLSPGPVVFDIQAGLILTYAFLHSDHHAFQATSGLMHFFRPGLEIGPRVEIPVTEGFLISMGWNAQLYIPQIVGGDVFKLPAMDEAGLASSLWFVGQLWLKLHFRFPYTTNF